MSDQRTVWLELYDRMLSVAVPLHDLQAPCPFCGHQVLHIVAWAFCPGCNAEMVEIRGGDLEYWVRPTERAKQPGKRGNDAVL